MPIHKQFASGRQASGAPSISVTSGGGLTSAVDLWIGLQKRNRVGYNFVSPLTHVAAESGQKIEITVPATERATGEDWHEFVIVAATTNDPTSVKHLAAIEGYDSNGDPVALPATITLDRNELTAIATTVANPNSLPTSSNRIHGMVRGVESLNSYYRYRADSTATIDGTNVLAADTGRWLKLGTPNTYITDSFAAGGCDISLQNASSDIATAYTLDGRPGEPFAFWLRNHNPEESGVLIPQGTRINLKFQVDGKEASQKLSGKMQVVFLGHVDTSTGILDDSIYGAGDSVTYTYGKSGLLLQEDLSAGQAWAFQVYPQMSLYEADPIPDGSLVAVSFDFYGQAGAYSEFGLIAGNLIASEDMERRRVVPGMGLTLYALPGSGMVASHVFRHIGTTLSGGLITNTSNQYAAIDTNGTVFVVQQQSSIPTTAAIRAIVSTDTGYSTASEWSNTISIGANGSIEAILLHPCNEGGFGTVRSDYPYLGGSDRGAFNPPLLQLFVKRVSDGKIFQLPTRTAVLAVETQQINFNDLSQAAEILALPERPYEDFCLYDPPTITVLAGSNGNIAAGNYQVACAYYFNGSTVASISHAPVEGCIAELPGTIEDLFASLRSWGESVADLNALKALDANQRYPYQCRPVINTLSGTQQYTFFPLATTGIKPNDLGSSQPGRWQPVNQGLTPQIAIGSVEVTDDPNGAAVTIGGTTDAPILNLTIPRGQRGRPGIGIPGEPGKDGVGGKPKLTNGNTYYVATDGNDNNDGLSQNTPFATIQKFIDTIVEFDLNDFYISCSVAAGAYNEAVYLKPLTGVGVVGISGAGNATIISCNNFYSACFEGNNLSMNANYGIYDMRLESVGYGIVMRNSHTPIYLGSIEFGTCGQDHIFLSNSYASSYYNTIAGGAKRHVRALGASKYFMEQID